MLRGTFPAPASFRRLPTDPLTRSDLSSNNGPADAASIVIDHLGEDVYHLRAIHPRWDKNEALYQLNTQFAPGEATADVLWQSDDGLVVRAAGEAVLRSQPELPLGVSGSRWMMCFALDKTMRFFGLGQKNNGFEKTGTRSYFFNTDVADKFAWSDLHEGVTDPMYVSVPWLVIKREQVALGIFIHNPYPSFVSVAAAEGFYGFEAGGEPRSVVIGAEAGPPELYLILGPGLRDLTRKFQRLVGTMPRPPVWSLGHHQSRWGYHSYDQLIDLDEKFTKYHIPTDAFWVDIDYMDGYRAFSFSSGSFDAPARQLAELSRRGRRVVPILDPGIKREQGYQAYEEAIQRDLVCVTPEGLPYVGYVWPGHAVFPDFSLEECRAWWSERVARLAGLGFSGFWCDMNEPATWGTPVDDMRFDHGRKDHDAVHNQYGYLMHKATRAGLESARPRERPFVISRSGCAGTGALGGIWNGDNVSNFHNLRLSIQTCLNLSLSGIPFYGSDVPGFIGDSDGDLMVAWYKAAFLLPLLRNHSCAGTARQEPWAFGRSVREIVAEYIRLRYKLIPYLYGLLLEHEEGGDPPIRPLVYEFAYSPGLPLDGVADQFMVGPCILQAPIVEPSTRRRAVVLPDALWFECRDGKWSMGGRRVRATTGDESTPIYVRYGSIVPMAAGSPKTGQASLDDIELHVFVRAAGRSRHTFRYRFDDGLTLAYKEGAESEFLVTVTTNDGRPEVHFEIVRRGAGAATVRLVFYEAFPEVDVVVGDRQRTETLKHKRWVMAGHTLDSYRSKRFVVD